MKLKPELRLRSYIHDEHDLELFYSKREHYTLLSTLSHLHNNQTLYDIGTYKGLSALALSANLKNRVVSYDIDYRVAIYQPDNVEFRVGNFFTDDQIFKSPLMLFDVDPHDGRIERQFVDWLVKYDYEGAIVFDDIHLNFEMERFWQSLTQEKVDYTNKGHWSGTGLVTFKPSQK